LKKKKDVINVLEKGGGVRLELGCGERKQRGFIGLDNRRLPGVDILHDLEVFPWPLPDESCAVVIASHVIEHIKPWLMIKFMDEVWRIMKDDGTFAMSHPYGVNDLYLGDPTHCNPCIQSTWQYFDPRYPLYLVYRPKPWRLGDGFPVWNVGGCMEVLYYKVSEKEGERMTKEEAVYKGDIAGVQNVVPEKGKAPSAPQLGVLGLK